MREDTARFYERQMLRALELIEDCLDRDLTLSEIAAAACLSPFHFHRVFTGMVGESVSAFVRRLRLERAADRLVRGCEPVMVIALRAGYDSNQSFTRAFTALFGEPPSVFRRLRPAVPATRAPSGYHYGPGEGLRSFTPVWREEERMDARTVELGPMKVLCVRHVGPYHLIGEAFERLDRAVGAMGLELCRASWLATYHDDPDSTPPAEMRSDACVVVDAIPDELPEPLGGFEIPGGLYATTRHAGSYSGLHGSWQTLVGSWVPANGLKPRCSPCFEIYVKGHESTSDENEFITDIYEPVERI
jgi:AraC family transcriptional regulator